MLLTYLDVSVLVEELHAPLEAGEAALAALDHEQVQLPGRSKTLLFLQMDGFNHQNTPWVEFV